MAASQVVARGDAVASTSAQLAAAPTSRPVVPHAAAAWEFFRSMGSPKLHVAPMVDQSELPFRMLCRKYGATCAYTPMMHARLTVEDPKYRAENFTTCAEDRPLFAQFCANDPDMLVRAARMVQGECDAIDINFGCPQRIAKRGFYGAFLMDDLPLVESLVRTLVQGIDIPVTCKIRVFPEMDKTLAYARMIEAAGCSVLAVHGRTRAMKDNSATRADWDAIKAVKDALQIPVLANGNIRNGHDAAALMAYTGCDGVLSAESLLEDPALFSDERLLPEGALTPLKSLALAREYCAMAAAHWAPQRMVKAHLHRILGPWLAEYQDVRERLNSETDTMPNAVAIVEELCQRVQDSGRDLPVLKLTARQQMREEKAQAASRLASAIEEQEREASALAALAAPIGSAAAMDALPAAAPASTSAPASTAEPVPAAASPSHAIASGEQAAAVALPAGPHASLPSGAGMDEPAAPSPSHVVPSEVVHLHVDACEKLSPVAAVGVACSG